MISVSYLSNIAPVFAQPRLFIGPEIPGCLSDRGTVLLPMTLDGRMTDTKGGEGDSTFLTKHRNQFVCRSPRVVVYHDRDAYEAAVHPPWLRRVRDWVDDDWERYASILADHPLQRTVLNRVKEGLQALSPLFSGCLYIGDYEMPRAEHFLYAHDLALYGKKVDVDDESLYPVLRLLETFYYAR